MAKAKTKTRYNFGYGAIYQRKTKAGKIRWYLDYRDAEGNRVQKLAKSATTKEEAQLMLKEEVSKILRKECGLATKKKALFCEFSQVYLDNYAKVRKRSWLSDQKYLNSQLIPYFGKMHLSEISPLHVNQFMLKRQNDGVKNSSINRELTVLKKMINLAIEWGYDVGHNPVKKGNVFSEEEYKRDRVLSYEEEHRLLIHAAPHLKPILKCALSTGMRYAEILGLQWGNVDLEKKQIIVKAKSSKSGKGRVIPINATLFKELLYLQNECRGESDFVFLYVDPGTNKLRPIKNIRRAFVMACRRAGISNITFHDLRHTFGTRLIEKGADPVAVKNILGHANLKTTEIYLHSSLAQMRITVEKLDDLKPLRAQKPENLLHMRYMDSNREKKKPVNVYFSVN